MEIPMIVLWIGVFWTIVYYLFSDYAGFSPQMEVMGLKLYSGMLAGMAAWLAFFLLSAGSKEKWMGLGDAYVALLAGLIAGWPNVLWVLLLAFASGAIYGIILIALGKKNMKSQVPFAPFLVAGVLLVIFIPVICPGVKYLLIF